MSGSLRHRHAFSALWWHFGPHGPQDVHVHSCVAAGLSSRDACERALVGPGRDCGGDDGKHGRFTLDGRMPAGVTSMADGGSRPT